jgi:hypothetical protein
MAPPEGPGAGQRLLPNQASARARLTQIMNLLLLAPDVQPEPIGLGPSAEQPIVAERHFSDQPSGLSYGLPEAIVDADQTRVPARPLYSLRIPFSVCDLPRAMSLLNWQRMLGRSWARFTP